MRGSPVSTSVHRCGQLLGQHRCRPPGHDIVVLRTDDIVVLRTDDIVVLRTTPP